VPSIGEGPQHPGRVGAALLGQEPAQLDLRALAALEEAVDLHQHLVLEDEGAVGLLGARDRHPDGALEVAHQLAEERVALADEGAVLARDAAPLAGQVQQLARALAGGQPVDQGTAVGQRDHRRSLALDQRHHVEVSTVALEFDLQDGQPAPAQRDQIDHLGPARRAGLGPVPAPVLHVAEEQRGQALAFGGGEGIGAHR
jgi:hypothetical protein